MRSERIDALAAQLRKSRNTTAALDPASRVQRLAAARLFGQRLASERLTLEQIEEAAGFVGVPMFECQMHHRLLWLVPMVPSEFFRPHDPDVQQELIWGIADVWQAVQERAAS